MPNYLDYLDQGLTTARAPFATTATLPVRTPVLTTTTRAVVPSVYTQLAPTVPVVQKSATPAAGSQYGTSRQALSAGPNNEPAQSSAAGHSVDPANQVQSTEQFAEASRSYLGARITSAQDAFNADPSAANKGNLIRAQNDLTRFENELKKGSNITPTAARQSGQSGFKFSGGISGGEQGPRTYGIDYLPDGTPVYLRTIYQNGTSYTTPIDRFTYETENFTQLNSPQAGTTVDPSQRPKAVAPQRNASDTTPAEFANLSPDAIAQLPTGPEYLKLNAAQSALDATGKRVADFKGYFDGTLGSGQIAQMEGGEEFLALVVAKSMYDQAVQKRANPAADNGPATPTAQQAAEQAPQVNTDAINALTSDTNRIQAQMLGIHADDGANSLAQQQLAQSGDLAQRHTLGLARGGSPRAVSALTQQALGEQAFIGSEVSQQKAQLLAQQEENTRQLRAEAAQAAADLGLNAAALDIDVNDLNMKSVSNYLSQMFADYRLNVKLDEDQAARVTNFIRDMALIEEKYDALDQASKNAFMDRELKKYGIRADIALALKKADADETQKWVDRGVAVAQTVALIGVASDRRVKTDIESDPDSELADLLGSLKSYSYDYKNPERHGAGRQMGVMAQDLQKTDIGRSMVSEDSDGVLRVDAGKAGLAALSGLALVYDKLKRIEEAL